MAESLGEVLQRLTNSPVPTFESEAVAEEHRAQRTRLRRLSKDERLIGEAAMAGIALMVPSYHRPHTEAACHRCRDVKWLSVNPTQPGYVNDLIPCPDCQGEEITNKRLAASGLGEGIALRTLESFRPNEHPKVRVAYDAARALLQPGAKPWLVLSGLTGCGKTHLCRGIGMALLGSRWSVRYMKMPDLIDLMRTTQAEDSQVSLDELVNGLVAVQCLILDDLGVERHTPWSVAELERLLDRRHEARGMTVISTNLSQAEIGRLSGRLLSRMLDREVCVFADMKGAPDYRRLPRVV